MPILLNFPKKYKLQLPEDWSYVLLGYEGMENFSLKQITENILQCHPYCTYAYIIKKSIIKTLMSACMPIIYPIDMQLQQKLKDNISVYVTHPVLVYQRSKSETYNKWEILSLTSEN